MWVFIKKKKEKKIAKYKTSKETFSTSSYSLRVNAINVRHSTRVRKEDKTFLDGPFIPGNSITKGREACQENRVESWSKVAGVV